VFVIFRKNNDKYHAVNVTKARDNIEGALGECRGLAGAAWVQRGCRLPSEEASAR